GAAATAATDRGLDQRGARGVVDALHQQPGAAVRHAQVPGRGADAPPALDPFEQFEPPLAEDGPARPLDPAAHADRPLVAPGLPRARHDTPPWPPADSGLYHSQPAALARGPHPEVIMLSARNQFKGTVKSVKLGEVMAEVVVTVGGLEIVSAITRGSAEHL